MSDDMAVTSDSFMQEESAPRSDRRVELLESWNLHICVTSSSTAKVLASSCGLGGARFVARVCVRAWVTRTCGYGDSCTSPQPQVVWNTVHPQLQVGTHV